MNDNPGLNERDMNFLLVQNRIAYYFKEVFNVEIINLFYKKNMNKVVDKGLGGLENYLETSQSLEFDFYILIKDNNKKIFKYKLIKSRCGSRKFKVGENKYIGFMENLYFFVDESLCKYCRKHYMDKHESERLNDILLKNNEINCDYEKWIIENYK